MDDRQPLKQGNLLKRIWGKLYGAKGYVGKQLSELLFENDMHLITGIRRNMKNQLLNLYDEIMLRKRSLIETFNDQLKNIRMIEHSRYRSLLNFLNNLLTGIIAYSFIPKKPSIKFHEFQPDSSNNMPLF